MCFHNGFKTFACSEMDTIRDFRKMVESKRLPEEDDHVNCRMHEHIKEAGVEYEVPVNDDLFVGELVGRWPSDLNERETHNFVYKVPTLVNYIKNYIEFFYICILFNYNCL